MLRCSRSEPRDDAIDTPDDTPVVLETRRSAASTGGITINAIINTAILLMDDEGQYSVVLSGKESPRQTSTGRMTAKEKGQRRHTVLQTDPSTTTAVESALGAAAVLIFVGSWLTSLSSPLILILALIHGYRLIAGTIICIT